MDKYRLVNKFKLISSLFIILILTTGMSNQKDSFNGKIFKNIYIEQVHIGKMKLDEAKKAVDKKYLLKPIYIKYEDKTWCINPQDIDLSYNIDDAIKNAYIYTRSDSKIENIKRKCNLDLNKAYSIKLNATYNESKLSEQLSYINLPVKVIQPTITTQQVKSINTVLGQFSTSFNEHSARGSNIYVAGKSTSDILIMPGDTFSYNKSTGARTWSNGYKTAKVIVGGKYVNGEGGGVCQVSTTIYNAALMSGLEIQEVHNHTYPSHYVSKGRDAAVSYGYTDFKFKNNFAHPIYIKNIVSNGSITSKIYGCSQDREKLYIRTQEIREKDKIIVKTYRVFLGEENNKIREELVSENKYKIK